MKIIYTENPLCSRVELTEQDKEIMKLRLTNREIYEKIFDAYYKLGSVDQIKTNLEDLINGEDEPDSKVNKQVNRILPYYIDSLENDIHCGDCTKVACSCTKCHAEDLLGIDTTDGIRCRYYIYSAFKGPDTTINEAIEYLSKVDEDRDEAYKQYWEGWDREKAIALESLLAYKEKHFPDKMD